MAARRAIVVGAGMGGLSAAIAVQDAGFEVVVLERMNRFLDVGAFSLWTNAMLAVQKLGLEEVIEQRGGRIDAMELRSSNGRLLRTLPLAEIGRKYGAQTVGVHRADLQDALAERLGRDRVRFAVECVGFDQDNGRVVARLADGGTEEADLLVGADGVESTIRAQLLGPEPAHYPGFTCWRSATKPQSSVATQPIFFQLYGKGSAFGLFPIGPDTICWYGTTLAPEGAGRNATPTEWRRQALEHFGDWWTPVREVIEGTDDNGVARQDIYDREPTGTWFKGAVALLGDAVHPAPPTLGQGGCMALEDGVVLGRCLREAPDIPSALAAYTAARMPRTSTIVKQAQRQGQAAHTTNPLKAGLRDNVIRFLPEQVVRRQFEQVIGFDA
jgi:2-polyprenyl-6-methoxyphenol hydroxylase-like FAD-dependent oxidoreductase